MLRYPVYIPSNRSPELNETFSVLQDEKVWVVNDLNMGYPESQFLASPTFEDRHLPRKRQWILDHTPSDFYWTLDDDLKAVYTADYEAKKARKTDKSNLIAAMESAEALMEPDIGVLTLKMYGFHWYGQKGLIERITNGSPAILWNRNALKVAMARFDAVRLEEDVHAMLDLMAANYRTVTFGGDFLVKFAYTDANKDDDALREFYAEAPAGSCWWRDGDKVNATKSRRLLSDGSKFLSVASSRARFKVPPADVTSFL